jgi:hypothetical protein
VAKLAAYPNVETRIREYPLPAGAAYLQGAAVVLNAGGEAAECGADPALILGFALHAAGADPNTTRMLVALAHATGTFFIQGSSNPVAADKGDSYGIAKDGDGIWVLDKTDAVATRLLIVDVDLTRNLYEVRVLTANRQLG